MIGQKNNVLEITATYMMGQKQCSRDYSYINDGTKKTMSHTPLHRKLKIEQHETH